MKTILAFVILSPCSLMAQNLIDAPSFFDPDFKVRRQGASSGVLNLAVTNLPVSGSGASGNLSWNHSAGGHAQVRTQMQVIVPVANLDAQLAAYTQTIGDSLVFGREITTDVQLLGVVDVGPTLQSMVNQVAGASVIYDWQSTATVNGLAIVPDQLYQVNFTVSSGGGLPVDVLDSATFGITNAGISGAANESSQLLNLLDVVSIGNDPSTGQFSFLFKSNQARSSLDFSFAASTGVGVSLLGGTAANQNVLTFSGFQVAAIPEPSSLLIFSGFVSLCLIRRRRNG